jgi:Cu+-exporting ATPase
MNRDVSIDIMVPSCACCSAKLEQELATLSGISKAAVRFAVPVKAQLHYDPTAVNVGKLLAALKERGFEVPLERVEFRIPARPTLHPTVWKARVERLSENLEGVISASIDFATSRIAVDYLPGFVGSKEIREVVLGWHLLHSETRRKEVTKDETAEFHGGSLEPERARGNNFHTVHSLGSGFSRFCDDATLGGAAAGL